MRIQKLLQTKATMKAILGAMALAALGLPLWPDVASAQSAGTAPRQAQPATPRDQDQSADGNGSLSNDLSQSRGIVRPPATGDHSVIEPPSTGPHAMPIIPPPGTPGGNPDVQPK